MTTEKVVEFVPLLGYENDYEILNDYPFTIRRKNNHYEVSENDYQHKGYPAIYLNRKLIQKHVLIAKQFIPNPNNLPQVDHINHDRTDYHIENLRWITPSENQRNKSSFKGIQYEYIDTLPNDYIDVVTYESKNRTHEFNDKEYYYSPSTDKFYYFNGSQYRILNINTPNDNKCVKMMDKNKRQIAVYYTKFNIQYDLFD